MCLLLLYQRFSCLRKLSKKITVRDMISYSNKTQPFSRIHTGLPQMLSLRRMSTHYVCIYLLYYTHHYVCTVYSIHVSSPQQSSKEYILYTLDHIVPVQPLLVQALERSLQCEKAVQQLYWGQKLHHTMDRAVLCVCMSCGR